MDILARREPPQELLKFISKLTWKPNKMMLLGSASLESQKYYADFDLVSYITKNRDKPFNTLYKILSKTMKTKGMYFIEGKIQVSDKNKKRFYKLEDLKEEMFEKTFQFIKLDYVIKINTLFYELSINYTFESSSTKEEIIKAIEKEEKELISDGEFYKALKRRFSIAKLKKDKPTMVRLTKLFNSPTGEMYKDVAIMKAIKSAIDAKGIGYKEPLDIKQYAISLKDLGSPTLLKNLPEILEYIETSSFEKMEEINQEADKYI
jgi:hypothetical protein